MTGVLELVFKDQASVVEHNSSKFKEDDLHWNLDTSVHFLL